MAHGNLPAVTETDIQTGNCNNIHKNVAANKNGIYKSQALKQDGCAKNENCQIIAISALLTTTMSTMADVVKLAEEAGIRDQVKIMVGGAPLTDAFAKKIGADAYTPDAATAAEAAVDFCKQ